MCQTCLKDGNTTRHDGTQEITHGTYAGYKAHQNRATPPCDLCREAERAYRRELYARRRRKSQEEDLASLL